MLYLYNIFGGLASQFQSIFCIVSGRKENAPLKRGVSFHDHAILPIINEFSAKANDHSWLYPFKGSDEASFYATNNKTQRYNPTTSPRPCQAGSSGRPDSVMLI